MDTELKSPSNEAAEKYGISVSCRIPAVLQRKIGDEAALRQISFASHLSSLVQIGHQKGEESNAETNILLRKNESLQQEVSSLKQQLEISEKKRSENAKDDVCFSKLRLNRDILEKHINANPVTIEKLQQSGFDFAYVTHTGMDQDKQYFCILNMSYRQEKNLIFIKPL
jgi:hypothetical protein